MKRVIERCPTCGVEHDEAVGGACEACGDTLRAWCRAHSRQIGWLDGPDCARCAEDEARRNPRARTAAARATAPAPAPAPPVSATPVPSPSPVYTPTPVVVAAPPAPAPAASAAPRKAGRVAERQGIGVRILNAILTAVWTGILFTIVGIGIGAASAIAYNGDIAETAFHWGRLIGTGGLIFGTWRGLMELASSGNAPEKPGA